MSKRILLTGAAGFIGSHVVEHLLLNTDWHLVCIVRLNQVGDLARISESSAYQQNRDRVTVVHHDLRSRINETVDSHIGPINYVLHLAANSHVDRSIEHPTEFYEDNVMGTANLLEWALLRKEEGRPIEKFINAGTDEVFGPVRDGKPFTEEAPYKPSNPYAAAKAGQCCAGHAAFVTHGLPVITTYMVNIFGERQNPEKLIPRTIQRLLSGKPMTVHCKLSKEKPSGVDNPMVTIKDGTPWFVTEIGVRCWMHARNAADGYKFLLEHGVPGEAYNLEAGVSRNNLDIIKTIADTLGIEDYKLDFVDFHSSRPGHDREYGLDGTKIRELGWVAPVSFEDSLKKTIRWTLDHKEKWL